MSHVRIAAIVCLLAAGTLAVYAQTAGFDLLTFQPTSFQFVNIDDPGYIFDHPHVAGKSGGLTGENVAWAFRSTYFSNWHPLTWLSYMLDAELYRPDPQKGIYQSAHGFHATNVAFHLANVLLVFWVLRMLTGATWRSAAVAGLFAVHPLHAESVAWISERKDVLSVFFGLLSIAAWIRYTQARGAIPRGRPGERRSLSVDHLWYAAAVAAYAASLMSKQMLVTLPLVLLLLDWWPLRRIARWSPPAEVDIDVQPPAPSVPRNRRAGGNASPAATDAAPARPELMSLTGAIIEKVPFFLLSLAGCLIAVYAQRAGGSLQSLDRHPLDVRILNSLLAYVLYLRNVIWPIYSFLPLRSRLGVFYPHPGDAISRLAAAAAGMLLVALTAACIWQARRRPYLLFGWLWFLGALVPVIGLVQVGEQQMADRYMYFPAIGLYVMIVWLACAVIDSPRELFEHQRLCLVVAAGALYVALVGLGWLQAGHWQNSETLYEHSIAVAPRNKVDHLNLASYHDDQAAIAEREGRYDDARFHLNRAVQHNMEALSIEWHTYDAHYNLGTVLLRRAALRARGPITQDEQRLRREDLALAVGYFMNATTLDPDGRRPDAPRLFVNTGLVWLELAQMGAVPPEFDPWRTARQLFERALASDPKLPEAHAGMGRVILFERGDPDQALWHFEQAWEVVPAVEDPVVHLELMAAYLRQGRRADALRHAERARELDRSLPDTETLLRKAESADGRG